MGKARLYDYVGIKFFGQQLTAQSNRKGLAMLEDGAHKLPPGKIVEVVTYLEMRANQAMKGRALPAGIDIVPVRAPRPDWYRDLFMRVGGYDWLWFSRLKLGDAQLASLLNDPRIALFCVELNGCAEGMLELDFREEGKCELAYFGLTSKLVGQGVGRALMDFAIETAWAHPIERFHVHTCSLDSSQALGFYRRSGFVATHQEVIVLDDPRLNGILPQDAGRHVPIFR